MNVLCYIEGYNYFDREDIVTEIQDNPYTKGTIEYQSWAAGYTDADDDCYDVEWTLAKRLKQMGHDELGKPIKAIPMIPGNLTSFNLPDIIDPEVLRAISDEIDISHKDKIFVDGDSLFEWDEQLILMSALSTRITDCPIEKVRILSIVKKILHAKK